MDIYKLSFISGLHVDQRGSGQPEVADEFIRSDTLSASISTAWATLYPEDAEAGIFEKPFFRVSSAFPFIGDTLLFPSPAWPAWGETDETERKRLKRVRWLSRGLFEQVISGSPLDLGKATLLKCGAAISIEETKSLSAANINQPWIVSERQRVMVDRFSGPEGGETFFFALQFFAEGCGLWFCADVPQSDKFISALDFLGDTGLGADRSSGLGSFRVSKIDPFYCAANPSSGWLTLSLFNPDPDDDDIDKIKNESAYGLVKRSGWISASSVGRPVVFALSEGSFFTFKPNGRMLKLIDATMRERRDLPLAHDIYRDFRAIAIPCAQPAFIKEDDHEK